MENIGETPRTDCRPFGPLTKPINRLLVFAVKGYDPEVMSCVPHKKLAKNTFASIGVHFVLGGAVLLIAALLIKEVGGINHEAVLGSIASGFGILAVGSIAIAAMAAAKVISNKEDPPKTFNDMSVHVSEDGESDTESD